MRAAAICRFRGVIGALALAASVAIGGCTTNPATGRSSFTGFMSQGDELRVGREEHPKILQEFGGEYPDERVRRYVQQIGERLARSSELPELKFTFTVLDSDVVNAFALPGGYVYVTRGLMALASTEAELAGVIGHEIGHVTARHTAERYSAAVGAGIFTAILGAVAGGAVGQVADLGAGMALAGYSRDQELEADTLGVRYLVRTNYDDEAMAGFLAKLQADSRLSAELAGRPGTADEFDIMQSHPRTGDRVRLAIEEAKKQGLSATNPRTGRDEYLDIINGLSWGGDRKNGWALDRVFLHPELKIRFEVPPGFRIFNGAQSVAAIGPDKSRVVFSRAPAGQDGRSTAAGLSPADYLRRVWARNASLSGVETITVNGFAAATGATRLQTRSGGFDVRLVAIRYDAQTMYRFMFVSPPARTAELSEGFRRVTYSFRALTDREAATARPPRIRVVTVGAGDTAESLARRMAIQDHAVERFRVINGLEPGRQPRPGEKVKIIDN